MIEATKLGNFIKPLVPYMARHSGPSINAALGVRTRKEIKKRCGLVEIGLQRTSNGRGSTNPSTVCRHLTKPTP